MRVLIKHTNTSFNSLKHIDQIEEELRAAEEKEVEYSELRQIAKRGQAYRLVDEFNVPFIVLDLGDCDKIQLHKFVDLFYKSFSVYPICFYQSFEDTNLTKYKLIYAFDSCIGLEELSKIKEGLTTVYGRYFKEVNYNGINLGTDKKVFGCRDESKALITKDIRNKIIAHIRTEEEKKRIELIKKRAEAERLQEIEKHQETGQEVQEFKEFEEIEEKVKGVKKVKQGQEQRAYKLKFTNIGFKKKPQGEAWNKIGGTFKSCKPTKITLEELVKVVERGDCFLTAYFNNKYGYDRENIINIPLLGLDIDKKAITMEEFTEIVYKDFNIRPVLSYPTFSDKEGQELRNFRLVYEFEEPVSADEYEQIYEGLICKYENILDRRTKNATRVWYGTNKTCLYNATAGVVTAETVTKILSCIPPKEKPKNRNTNRSNRPNIDIKPIIQENKNLNTCYIRPEYKDEVLELLHNSIDIYDYIVKHFGGSFKDKGKYWQGCCPIHGGDNPTAFCIYKDTNLYTCYTNCSSTKEYETGNVVSLAYKVYNSTDFSSVAIALLKEYQIPIEDYYLNF